MRTRTRTRLIVLFRRRMMASLRYGLRNRSDIDSRNGLVIDTRDPDIPARQLETRQNKAEGEKNAGHVSAGNVHRAQISGESSYQGDSILGPFGRRRGSGLT
jgi:hypothetical protein